MNLNNFLVVSNRLPISVSKRNDKLEYTSSNGGLATAMSSLKGTENKLWIGWPGIADEDLTSKDKKEITEELLKSGCVPVWLTRDQIAKFYEGYSNDTIWPLFHYFQSYAQYTDEYWAAYQEVNQLYLKAVQQYASETAKVWVHDYHLMLLPALIRTVLPDTSIGFFLHIPFPSYEIFRLLPQRRQILEGLLGSDLIGFHIYDYTRHFTSSCLRILGISSTNGVLMYEGRKIKTDAYPIGIDYAKFRTALKSPAVRSAVATYRDSYPGQKLILSVDRLDYSKGILERLEAYRRLIEHHPDLIRKVKLVMIAVPSRTEVDTYRNLRDIIEQTVSRINGEFGTVDWAPISYQFQNLPFDKIVALYNQSHVALVTPLRDGMNLVAKEYVASKTKANPGVLILSEMTGAADELPESLVINPNDATSIESAIKDALDMPKDERLSRQESMQARIASYTVQKWGEDFMNDLAEATKMRIEISRKQLTASDKKELAQAYHESQSALIILDYDGTIRDFKSSPKASVAKPTERIMRLITALGNRPGTRVAIVSGRPRSVMESWFAHNPVTLFAEHGAWARHDGEWSQIDTVFSSHKKTILPVLERHTSRTAGSLIEEKDYALVWHYRNVAPEMAFVRAADLKREVTGLLVDNDTVGVYSGNKIIEIKPREVHKGYAAMELMALFPSEFVLCAGDDYTDEDMFRELGDSAVTIKVGNGDTEAKYQVKNVEQMMSLLEKLAEI